MSILGAWLYYFGRVLRNRLLSFVRRLKRPRNLIGLLLAAVYIWFFFLRFFFGRDFGSEGTRDSVVWILTAFFYFQLQMGWLFSGFGRGLVFRESEVQILFPSPVSRAQLLLFKWVQVQFGLILFSIIAALTAGRLPGGCGLCAGLGMFVASNFFYVHSIFAAIVLHGVRRRLGPVLTLVPACLLLGAVALCAAADWRTGTGLDDIEDLDTWLADGSLRILLAPLRLFAVPILATGFAEFARAIALPVGLLALQAWLVVRMNPGFEDQAVVNAGKVSRLRTEGLDALKAPEKLVIPEGQGSLFRLAPTGPAWRALVWKNLLSIGRIDRRRFLGFGFAVIPIAIVVFTMSKSVSATSTVGFLLLIFLPYFCLLGPALIRVDLRLDIPHFDVLKAMPIRGRELIFGEVFASVLVLFAIELLVLLLGSALFAGFDEFVVTWVDKAPFVIAAIPVLFALTFALVCGENLLALYLPSFVRLGRGMKAGFEQFGQNLVGTVVRLLALLILFLLPGAAGGGVAAVGHFALKLRPETVVPITAVVFALVLIAESLALIALSEGRYERFDLGDEQLSQDS